MRALLLTLVLVLSGCQSGLDNVKNLSNLIDVAPPTKIYKDESNLWHYIANHQRLVGQNQQRVDVKKKLTSMTKETLKKRKHQN